MTGCGGIDYRSVIVLIKEEYGEKFDAEEFTINDFNWSNINSLSYYRNLHYNDSGEQIKGERFFWIWLNQDGRENVLQAKEHFSELDFVEAVGFYYHGTSPIGSLNALIEGRDL